MGYGVVSADFWPDTVEWGDDERTAALYLLTCSHRRTEGLFRVPDAYAAHDMGWTTDRFAEAALRLIDRGWAMRDGDWLLIVKALRLPENQPRGPKQVTGAVNAVAQARADGPLFAAFLRQAERYCEPFGKALRERFGTPSIPHAGGISEPGYPSDSSNSNSYSNSNSTSSSAGAAGCAPSQDPTDKSTPSPKDDDDQITITAALGQVVAVMRKVPDFEAAFVGGADAAVLSLMQGHPNVPWIQLAHECVASKLDTAGGLTTRSPRTALTLSLDDHLAGPGRRRGRGAAVSGDGRSWDQVQPVVFDAVLRAGNELDALASLRGDVALASVVVTAGWKSVLLAARGAENFETRQAARQVRDAWEGLQPSAAAVDQRFVEVDRQVSERCRAGGHEGRHELGYATAPLDREHGL